MAPPLYGGAQLAIDTTMVCTLRRDGTARPHAANQDGTALVAARRRKASVYPELPAHGARAQLVVLGCEVGDKRSLEARSFIHQLATAHVRSELPRLRKVAAATWERRWLGDLSGDCSARSC